LRVRWISLAPRTASAGESNALAPSASSAFAFSAVRFQTCTVSPRSSILRTKLPPSRPVPSQAIKAFSYRFSVRRSVRPERACRRCGGCLEAGDPLGMTALERVDGTARPHEVVLAAGQCFTQLLGHAAAEHRVGVVLGEDDVVGAPAERHGVTGAQDLGAAPLRRDRRVPFVVRAD